MDYKKQNQHVCMKILLLSFLLTIGENRIAQSDKLRMMDKLATTVNQLNVSFIQVMKKRNKTAECDLHNHAFSSDNAPLHKELPMLQVLHTT